MVRRGCVLLGAVLVLAGVAWAQPANDDCTNATVIPLVPFTDTIDVTGATGAVDDPLFDCDDFAVGGTTAPTVWYRYTAPAAISLQIDTFASTVATRIAIHDGTCGAFTNVRACNDNDFDYVYFGDQSRAIVTLAAGETVYVEVFDEDGGGAITLHVEESPVFQVSPWQPHGIWPAVAPMSDGGFIVAWHGRFPFDDSIRARRYDASGAATGTDFQVSDSPIGYFRPDVASVGEGFVVVWSDPFVGRLFDATGAPLGGEFEIDSSPAAYQLQVASDAAGNFMVVWDTSAGDVLARRFDANAAPQGPAFVVNTYTTGSQVFPSISIDGSGNFVVVWQDGMFSSGPPSHDGDGNGVFAQRLDPTGVKVGPEFQVNTTTTYDQSYPVVASDAAGNFMVFWWDSECFHCVDGRRYAPDGTPQSGSFRVDAEGGGFAEGPPLGAAADAAGNFVVVWPGYDAAGMYGEAAVFGQHFDWTGAAAGPVFQVTHLDDIYQHHPDVAALDDGRFVVVWHWTPFGSHHNIMGRVIDGLGGQCPPQAVTGCHTATVPGKAKLSIRNRTPDNGDTIVWKWVRGDETLLAELGDPTISDAYTLCLYDAAGKALDLTVPPGGTCGTTPCWRDLGADGFKYVNKGSVGPVRKLVLVPGVDGESRIIVKAKGDALPTPAIPLTAPLEVRLLGPAGACWATTFAPADVTINTASDLKAKGGT